MEFSYECNKGDEREVWDAQDCVGELDLVFWVLEGFPKAVTLE